MKEAASGSDRGRLEVRRAGSWVKAGAEKKGMDRVMVREGVGGVDVKRVCWEEMLALWGAQEIVQQGLTV